jgi:hypothetical protein
VTASDLLRALGPVVDALEALGVGHYVGGSVASSVHGMPRTSIDADLVADLGLEHVAPLVERLSEQYYLDEGRIRSSIEAQRSFNLIHLDTMFKIDVFVSKRRPYDLEALRRARAESLESAPSARRFPVSSPEDTILAKLEWFRSGNEVSERQWSDVVGVLRARLNDLDIAYLERWAAALGVVDLLDRARREVSG